MKKIKTMSHLREQKAILKARQLQAEKNVRIHWNNLKDELRPSNLSAGVFNKFTENGATEKHNRENILKSTFTYGLTLLVKKVTDVAEEKIKKIFKK